MTRSWNVHVPSTTTGSSLENTKKGKISIKAGNEETLKENETSNNAENRKYLGKQKYLDLPPEDFVYGMKTRVHTPMKDIINNYYANKAEEEVRKSYDEFFEEKSKVKKLVIKKTPHFKKMEELKKRGQNIGGNEEKPLYKLKMFQNVGSKVTEGIKQFKTYKNNKKLIKKEGESSLDNIVQQVQEEIKTNEQINA